MQPALFHAQAQQILSRETYFSVAFAQVEETFPNGMSDNTEVALEDDGVLFLLRDTVLAEIKDQSVQIAFQSVLGRLQVRDVVIGPFLAGRAVAGGFV